MNGPRVLCPRCDGTGSIECGADHGGGYPVECGETLTCPSCRGKGSIAYPLPSGQVGQFGSRIDPNGSSFGSDP